MRSVTLIHILGGFVALAAGYVALFAPKGGTVHRRVGMLFVWAILVMCVGGLAVAIGRAKGMAINIPAALITSYLAITSLGAVRPFSPAVSRPLHLAGMAVALAVAATMLAFAVEAVAAGGSRNGIPAFPFVMFGVVATLGLVGDVRVLRSGPLRGGPRLARHLWRMSFALFVAAMSFFYGPTRRIPEPLRLPALRYTAPLIVLFAMLYWLWRVRGRRRAHGLVARAIEAA